MNTAHASASPNQTLDSIHQKPPAQLAKKQGETEHDVPSTASEKKKSGSYASKAIPLNPSASSTSTPPTSDLTMQHIRKMKAGRQSHQRKRSLSSTTTASAATAFVGDMGQGFSIILSGTQEQDERGA
ncbi:hypothetical protein BM1_05635 [Bipolaris maydis]|nr:hypothetical protein BM1_05635 [Bipolaris maydis]